MELSFAVEKVHILSKPRLNVLAYADLLVNNQLVIKGMRVCSGKNGAFVSFPQTKGKENEGGKAEWYNNAYLKDKEMDKTMQAVVLKGYETKKASQN